MRRIGGYFLIIFGLSVLFGRAQEKEDRTLLPMEMVRAIVDEASGETAWNTLKEIAPYPRDRKEAEYKGHFFESDFIAARLKEYRLKNVTIDEIPQQTPTWDGEMAELWMISPERQKLVDYKDIPTILCTNSESADVTAELVDVGIGSRPEDYQNKDIKGKIVLGSSNPAVLQRLGVWERGAIGVISYSSFRPEMYPEQILWEGIGRGSGERKTGFGFKVSAQMGRMLVNRLQREKITLHAKIRTRDYPGELEIVHAYIPGDGSSNQALVVSAHLFEGYAKQGANDDGSGSAAILEVARALTTLIAAGKVPAPKRDIYFVWVPEISGTRAFLQKYPDLKKRFIADINQDMVGESLKLNNSFFVLHRTPDSFPSFLNDVMTNFVQFVGETNRERVRYRANGYGYSYPIVAPNGTRDPFYYKIDKHYGASDHAVYLAEGIPAIIMNCWPDMFYHSSMDTPDKADSTQLKRAVVIASAAAIAIASADDRMAFKIAGEVLGRGEERSGEGLTKALGYLEDATEQSAVQAYKDAVATLKHCNDVERGALRSSGVFFSSASQKALEPLVATIDMREKNQLSALDRFYRSRFGSAPPLGELTPEEKEAAQIFPKARGGAFGGFGGGGGGGGGQSQRQAQSGGPAAEQMQAMRRVPQHMSAELRAFMTKGDRSALQIRDALTGEFEPLSLSDLLAYLKASEKIGAVELVKK
ncbi:MAG TPA: M28 family peptidase [Acidobacteriota bacterium]|jgi:hypothetical protein|nr:M28 family peptidase [Acidobacteriota bacterium]